MGRLKQIGIPLLGGPMWSRWSFCCCYTVAKSETGWHAGSPAGVGFGRLLADDGSLKSKQGCVRHAQRAALQQSRRRSSWGRSAGFAGRIQRRGTREAVMEALTVWKRGAGRKIQHGDVPSFSQGIP
jgi:hypothetical protein